MKTRPYQGLFKAVALLSMLAVMQTALARTPPLPVVSPENLQFEATGFDSAVFTWDDSSAWTMGKPNGYQVFIDGEFIREGNFNAYSIGGRFIPGNVYEFSVYAYFGSGQVSEEASISFSTNGYTVSNLRSDIYSQTAAELFWEREPLNSSSMFYEIFRDGQLVGTTTGNSFFDATLSPGTSYLYEVVIVKSDKRSDAASEIVKTAGTTTEPPGPGSNCANVVNVNNGIISWPSDGWYQVQSLLDYTSVCEGGTQCKVNAGTYNVINLSTGLRCENVAVGNTPKDDDDNDDTTTPGAPKDARVQFYSATAVELFWTNASDSIVATEVYRDGTLLGVSQGNSYYDDSRNANTHHRYTLIAVDTNNNKAEALDLGGMVEQLQLSHPGADSFYRTTVSLDENTLAVGFAKDQNELGNGAGIVYLYELNDNQQWVLTQQILSPDGVGSKKFGANVKLDEGLLLVRGYSPKTIDGNTQNIEQVYIYQKNDVGQWNLMQSLVGTLPTGKIPYQLGDSFDVDDNTLFIGSSVNDGFVFVYTRNDQNLWEQTQVLSVDYPFAVWAEFGSAVAIDGDTALIGAAGSEEVAFNSGSTFVYKRDANGLWQQQDMLLGSALEEFSYSGGNIELQGDTAIIATTPSDICSRFGVQTGNDVYVFERDSSTGTWSEAQRLVSSLVQGEDVTNGFVDSEMFGSSIALEGDTLLIGAAGADALAQAAGAVYVFKRDAQGQWIERDRLVDSEGAPGSQFGNTVSLSGDTAVVGQYCGVSAGAETVKVYQGLATQ